MVLVAGVVVVIPLVVIFGATVDVVVREMVVVAGVLVVTPLVAMLGATVVVVVGATVDVVFR